MDTPETLVARARVAQASIEHWEQARVDDVVAALAWEVYRPETSRRLCELAAAESGLGNVEHLYEITRRRILGALADLHGVVTTGVVEDDPAARLVKIAKPVGVIAAASPATAPCSGITCNAIAMLKGRNALVVSPNPRALRASVATVDAIRAGLTAAGAPADLVLCAESVDRDVTARLMAAADLVVAVGGPGTVRRAYSSGTPAIGAGRGNPVVLVDETADVTAAARLVAAGASYNNGTSCSSESTVLVAQPVAAAFVSALVAEGGRVCDSDESKRLAALLWHPDGHLNRDAIGRAAADLADEADIDLAEPAATSLLVLCGDLPDGDLTTFGEKLAPVVRLAVYDTWPDALAATERILGFQGIGHSCAIHTARDDRVAELAERMKVTRVMVNQSTAFGNSGAFDNGLPFTSTIACGTWGRCSHSENVTWRDFVNITTVSRVTPRRTPDETVLFGEHPERRP